MSTSSRSRPSASSPGSSRGSRGPPGRRSRGDATRRSTAGCTPVPPPPSAASTAGPRPAGASWNAMSGGRKARCRPATSRRPSRSHRGYRARQRARAGSATDTRTGSTAADVGRGWIDEQTSVESVHAAGRGRDVVEFRQGFRFMSAPTRELEKLVVSRKLAQADNPVTRWMASNVAVAQDPRREPQACQGQKHRAHRRYRRAQAHPRSCRCSRVLSFRKGYLRAAGGGKGCNFGCDRAGRGGRIHAARGRRARTCPSLR